MTPEQGAGTCNVSARSDQVLAVSVSRAASSFSGQRDSSSERGVAEFEAVYRANVAGVTSFFARRCGEPQEVADLTSETFVQAVGSLGSFDPRRGTPRAWLFGIARHVYPQHCKRTALARSGVIALAGHRPLGEDEIEELAARIDAERIGRELIAQLDGLPERERVAFELVDLASLTPREAASMLGIAPGALRVRLFRARRRLRNGKDTQ
jgi:RNA polymerase sigma factor (sigma-70 family)